jgi:HD-GYP domain-containing protein (c-di-GMP phosphodiesterase class II)
MQRITKYVIAVCVAAVLLAVGLYLRAPAIQLEHVQAAACFAALGIFAYALAHTLTAGAGGSIAFIPFVASVALAPSWTTVVAISIAVTLVEGALHRAFLKAVFNVAQTTLAVGTAVATYQITGGQSLLHATDFRSVQLAFAFLAFLVVNTAAVSGAVAASERRRIWQVWRSNTKPTVIYDLLSMPFVFLLAWAYSRAGAAGAVCLAFPLFGVRQLYKSKIQLEKNSQDLLELMVAAIEARDPYTSGHSRRVARSATVIARIMGLTSRQVERVGVAALLHDVGKIHEVFAPILRKPDRLTPEEWAIMQTHPIKSEELVKKVSQLSDIVKPVRHHHENWDGSGYPDGLMGEEIPLFARIIMFADTMDAMTTDRPYRSAMTETDVIAEFKRHSGRQFDPSIAAKILDSPQFRGLFVVPAPVGASTPLPVSVVARARRASSLLRA